MSGFGEYPVQPSWCLHYTEVPTESTVKDLRMPRSGFPNIRFQGGIQNRRSKNGCLGSGLLKQGRQAKERFSDTFEGW